MDTPPSRPEPERASRRLAILFALVIAAVYANGLTIPFQFDDEHALEHNPAIRSLANIPRFFVDPNTSTVLRENKDLRPVLLTTFALNYAVSGDATWSYHVLNLVLHWLAVLLVFRIVRDHLWLGADAVAVAAGAALVMAAHPLNTEAVDYLSARSALLTTVFYLGAFDAAVRQRPRTCLLLFTLALLTKAIAVTLPLALLGYWLLARRRGGTAPPWGLLAALAALAVAGVLYRALLLPPYIVEVAHEAGVTPLTYFMTEWSAYLYYLRLFLWPNALVVDRLDYPLVHSLAQPQACVSLAVLVALGALAWRARERWPAVTFAALWYVVALAAESTIFRLAEPVNEHRPYLAMLGLGTAAGLVLWRLAGLAARRAQAPPTWVFAVVMTLVTSVLGAATVARNATWHDEYTLWLDALEKAPQNPRAWLNTGHAAMVRGNDAEARRLLLEAHRLRPCYAYVQMNLSALAVRQGDGDEGLRWADEAVACNAGLALSHHYRGSALERLGRFDEALAEYRQTTAIDPQHADAWISAGRLLERNGVWDAAFAAYERAFAANPTDAEAAMLAGLVQHYQLRNPAGAVEWYRRVLRAVPTHYGAHYQLAIALLASGQERDARIAWNAFEPLAKAIGDRASLEGAPEVLRRPSAGGS